MKHVWRFLRLLGCGFVSYAALAYLATAFGRGKVDPAQETGALLMFILIMTALLFLAWEIYLALRRRLIDLEARVAALEEKLERQSSATDEVE